MDWFVPRKGVRYECVDRKKFNPSFFRDTTSVATITGRFNFFEAVIKNYITVTVTGQLSSCAFCFSLSAVGSCQREGGRSGEAE